MPKSIATAVAPQNATISHFELCTLLEEIEGAVNALDNVASVLNSIANGNHPHTSTKALASVAMDSLNTWLDILDKAVENTDKQLQGVSRE